MQSQQSNNSPPAGQPAALNPPPLVPPKSDQDRSTLSLADPQPTTPNLQPATCNLLTNNPAPLLPIAAPSSQAAAVIDAKPLPAPAPRRKVRRNGRVASLPKLERDMVNHMLANAVPYKNIVAALAEDGYAVTERNISNWATGGFLEWSLAQEHVLQNRLDQDHLLDFLRRDDAPELPEVGL